MQQEKALARAKVGTGATIDFAGTWENELRSEVVLIQANGVLSGTYESAVSSGGTKTAGDLVGYVDGDLISFTVHWRDFQAITSWVGQLIPGTAKDTIKTLWQMTKQVDPGGEWASINAGSDTFTRK
ncbi:MAG TPA: avidin/streptavidin family protein [Sphingomonas sp.]|jgi:hypothetical protein